MSTQNTSTILSVAAAVVLFLIVMLITMSVTTEADDGFRDTSEQTKSMDAYYEACPFKKAELEDLQSSQSIREYVEFVSVTCDPEKKQEKVIVKLLDEDTTDSQRRFENWLKDQALQEGDSLQITLQK